MHLCSDPTRLQALLTVYLFYYPNQSIQFIFNYCSYIIIIYICRDLSRLALLCTYITTPLNFQPYHTPIQLPPTRLIALLCTYTTTPYQTSSLLCTYTATPYQTSSLLCTNTTTPYYTSNLLCTYTTTLLDLLALACSYTTTLISFQPNIHLYNYPIRLIAHYTHIQLLLPYQTSSLLCTYTLYSYPTIRLALLCTYTTTLLYDVFIH